MYEHWEHWYIRRCWLTCRSRLLGCCLCRCSTWFSVLCSSRCVRMMAVWVCCKMLSVLFFNFFTLPSTGLATEPIYALGWNSSFSGSSISIAIVYSSIRYFCASPIPSFFFSYFCPDNRFGAASHTRSRSWLVYVLLGESSVSSESIKDFSRDSCVWRTE